VDRTARRIGVHFSAREQLAVLDQETRQRLEAFVRGVTAGARQGCQRPAPEFALLRAGPTPYEATDVLANLKYIAFVMSLWMAKLVRLRILRADGAEAVAALSRAYPEWQLVTAPVGRPAGPALDRLGEDLSRLAVALGLGGASNNWVLNAARTATGRPLLANDPHMAATIPAPWYLVHLRTPGWAVAGACYIGAPLIAAGHNETAAWGVTAGIADNLDLFLEEVGADGRSVREEDGFVPCSVRTEVIGVRGRPPVREEILITPRGPLITSLLEGEWESISMRATWSLPRPAAGLFRLYQAHTFEEFRQALRVWPFVSVNMVYADVADTIGWQLAGDVPQREKGWGTLPLPGWDRANAWCPEPLPFDALPHLANPASGFIATANNKPTLDEASPYLGMDWGDGYRHARIVEALAGRSDWDVPSTQALQLDLTSLTWREIRAVVLAAPATTVAVQEALALLRRWDGAVAAHAPAAAVYEFFLSEIAHRVVGAKAPRSVEWVLSRGLNPGLGGAALGVRVSSLARLLREQPTGYFARPWPEEIAAALDQAIHTLRARFGASPGRWAWGRIRPLTLMHPLGTHRVLGRAFNLGPFPVGGDSSTVSPMGTGLGDPTGNPEGMANLRMVLDVGNWEENRFVLAGGQSGNPLSPHYADMLDLWRRGEGVTMAWSREMVAQVAQSTLRLLPTGEAAQT
jgi:penicillin amidase